MNLLLFQTQGGDPYPILEIVSGPKPGFARGSGRWAAIKKGIYRAYRRLMDRIPYHERLCSQLRHASDLRIVHPSTLSPGEAEGRLRAFLNARHKKHGRWFKIDAVLSVVGGIVGLPLIPLPGPNFLFFIPAARTLGHYLARKGAQQALNCDNLSFRSEPLIDQVQNHLQDLKTMQDTLAELVERYHLQDLEKLLIPLGKK